MRSFALFFAGAVALAGCAPRVPGQGPNPRLEHAIDLGQLSPDAELDIVIGLSLRDAPRLGKFLAEQPYTRDAMTPIDFGERFAVSAAEYAELVGWLRAQGLTVTRESPGRTSISVRGPAANLERAFATRLHRFSDGDGEFVASVNGWSLAPEVSPNVSGIVGLAGEAPWRPHYAFVPRAGNAGSTNPYSANDIEGLYATTGISMPGAGETIVILGAGLAPASSDVSAYWTGNKPYGLTTSAMPGKYSIETVGGANRDDMATAQAEQGENTLDIEMVQALAPYANVVHVITATNTPGLFADGIAYIVNQHASAHAVSVSYGTCERGAAGIMPVMNAMFMQAKAEGQSWFFAAGDTGTDACRDGTGNKIISAGYPASSPFVIGVGGTQIASGGGETTWNSWNALPLIGLPGAGGGGPSESMDKPAYQQGTDTQGKPLTPADGARDEPDVAALAGPPYININVMGTSSPVAGTSAAAPMWASVWALLEQAKSHATITNIHETLYVLGKNNGTNNAFHDIADNSNNGGPNDGTTGGYPAVAGYDLATGWGSPNVPNLIKAWP